MKNKISVVLNVLFVLSTVQISNAITEDQCLDDQNAEDQKGADLGDLKSQTSAIAVEGMFGPSLALFKESKLPISEVAWKAAEAAALEVVEMEKIYASRKELSINFSIMSLHLNFSQKLETDVANIEALAMYAKSAIAVVEEKTTEVAVKKETTNIAEIVYIKKEASNAAQRAARAKEEYFSKAIEENRLYSELYETKPVVAKSAMDAALLKAVVEAKIATLAELLRYVPLELSGIILSYQDIATDWKSGRVAYCSKCHYYHRVTYRIDYYKDIAKLCVPTSGLRECVLL